MPMRSGDILLCLLMSILAGAQIAQAQEKKAETKQPIANPAKPAKPGPKFDLNDFLLPDKMGVMHFNAYQGDLCNYPSPPPHCQKAKSGGWLNG